MRRVIGWIVVLFVVAAACQSVEGEEPRHGIGDAAPDGQFTFTVTSFGCDERPAGGAYVNRAPIDTFCFLDLSARNIGTEPRELTAGAQRLVDTAGRRFAADFGASWLESERWPSLTVNPGSTAAMTVVFDVADPGAMVAVELHDSVLSRGVRVDLAPLGEHPVP